MLRHNKFPSVFLLCYILKYELHKFSVLRLIIIYNQINAVQLEIRVELVNKYCKIRNVYSLKIVFKNLSPIEEAVSTVIINNFFFPCFLSFGLRLVIKLLSFCMDDSVLFKLIYLILQVSSLNYLDCDTCHNYDTDVIRSKFSYTRGTIRRLLESYGVFITKLCKLYIRVINVRWRDMDVNKKHEKKMQA